ncbi:DUF302 domain-containing protein [Methylobacterium sp. A52T]
MNHILALVRRRFLRAGIFLVACGQAVSCLAESVNASDTGNKSMNAQATSTTISIKHVVIHSRRSFDAVRTALEAALPKIDHRYASLVASGHIDAARTLLSQGAPLSIFGSINHGGLLRIAGHEQKAIQYDIGNPLTAARMTQHAISAALNAPIRVLLREDADKRAVIEYDRPVTTFGQLHNPDIDLVARDLDHQLRSALLVAAG